ncbi:hypothetical protein VMCG_08253 [Cytospora schulzeri]|uniref:beta-glucosidase n=1 Tax=Cytospora schulzeri TaxID=448051 RepID=A0A423VSJ8_9PEZI|nr:hypothetical protein VMCG_08253 [Valsa malicola]
MQTLSILLLAAAGIASADDHSHDGNYGSPYPGTTYPGFESDNPVTVDGSISFQESPPKYPSPWGEGLGDWADAYTKARAFVSQLTLDEKINLTTGTGWELDSCVGQTGSIPRLGFRAMCLQDSPTGVRSTDFNSVFPAGVNVAATWDRDLAYARGKAMGEEHLGKGVDMQLGPVAGPLGRAPTSGRNWEGFSPDPVLTGQMFAESIKGIQSAGVMTSAKHYIAYEQEHFRLTSDATKYGFNTTESGSANLDDVTMHELYLWPFADGVKAGATSVMCSYNQVNDSQACQNSYTLNYLLKGELGFQGFVVSDWYGTHSGVASVLAGLDMTMPGEINSDGYSYFGSNLTIAVLNGTVPQWRIDDMAVRIMAGFFFVDLPIERDPVTFSSWTLDTYGPQYHYVGEGPIVQVNQHVDVTGNHSAIIRQLSAASTVLLKNTNGTLPLKGTEKLTTVFGEDAGASTSGPNGCSDRGCSNGTLGMAWGSGSSSFPYLVTPDTAIQNHVLANGGAYESVFNNWDLKTVGALARRAQDSNGPALVFVDSNSGEGYLEVDGNLGDRNNLTMWRNGDALISAVTAQCNNTIVVVHSVGPVMLEEYANNPNVTALIWAGIPGQESGNAIVDILYGNVNPGAKLPFTIAADRSHFGADVLYTPNDPVPQMNFQEGVFIDYRSVDKFNLTPTYEFGFGLSYTTFDYSDLHVTKYTNVTDYTPFTGYTSEAGTYGSYSLDAKDYLFPDGMNKTSLYIYPWLNSTDLAKASGNDVEYNAPVDIPENAQNGSAQLIPKAGGAPGGNPRLYDVLYTVTASVTNTGSVAGDEVAQLYISRGGPHDPIRELRGFERLRNIQPQETRTFTVDITRRDISSWSSVEQDWFVQNTTKPVYVGRSSRDLPLSGTLL